LRFSLLFLFCPVISSVIFFTASFLSSRIFCASITGLPLLRNQLLLLTASSGVRTLFWSLAEAQPGLYPWRYCQKFFPQAFFIKLISFGEQTTPSKPAFFAFNASCLPFQLKKDLFFISSFIVFSSMLVRIVTPANQGLS